MIFDLWWAAQVENSMMFHKILKREVSGVWRIPIHGIHCIEDSSCVSCLGKQSWCSLGRLHTPRHSRIKCRRCFVRRMWISSRIVETMLFATQAIVGRTESIACVLVRSDKSSMNIYELTCQVFVSAFFMFTGTWGDDPISYVLQIGSSIR